MTERESFLRAIAASPDDDLPRLVYADWLDEHGDPDRAEFVRTQVTLHRNSDGQGDLPAATMAQLKGRERVLLAHNRDRWLQPLRELNVGSSLHGHFSRGFVDHLIMDVEQFIARGDELFRINPVDRLRLNNLGRSAKQLARCPHLAGLRSLGLGGARISGTALRTVLSSPHLSGLTKFRTEGVPLRDTDLTAIATATDLPSLTSLSLAGGRFTGDTLPSLLERFPTLEELNLSHVDPFRGEAFAGALAALNPTHFRKLCLDPVPLGAASLRALAADRRFTGITELWLRGCRFDAEAMQALVSATHLTKVEKLYLADDQIGEAGGEALAEWPGLKAVRTLNVDGCGIGPGGCVALARSPFLGQLDRLELRDNRVGDEGATALAECLALSGLHTLCLPDNALTVTAAEALARSPYLAGLRHLDLSSNAVGDYGAEAIADSPYLRHLRWLTVDDNGVSREVSRRLFAAFPDLTAFHGDGGFLWGEHLAAVREGMSVGGSPEREAEAVENWMVRTMVETPNDMAARRLYGSFLSDAGSPWWFVISMQDPDDWAPEEVMTRWRGWFEGGRDRWLAPLTAWANVPDGDAGFDRGFLRTVRFRGPVPEAVAEELARFPPLALLPVAVQQGTICGEGAFQVLARQPSLAHLRRLEFRSITTTELGHLLASPHLTALAELAVGPCGFSDDGVRLLADSPVCGRLRELDLGWVADAESGIANRVGPAGLAALGGSPHASRLRSLGLHGNRTVGDGGLEEVLAASHLTALTSLDVRGCELTAAGVRMLTGSPRTKQLHSLRIGGGDPLGEDAAQVLDTAPALADIAHLEVAGVRLRPRLDTSD